MHNIFHEIDCTILDLGLHMGDDELFASHSRNNHRRNVTNHFKLNPRKWKKATKLYPYYNFRRNDTEFWNETVWYPNFNGSVIVTSWFQFRVRLQKKNVLFIIFFFVL